MISNKHCSLDASPVSNQQYEDIFLGRDASGHFGTLMSTADPS